MALCGLAGAGVWLPAAPVDEDRTMDAVLFQTALKRRMRMPVYDHDFACPCGGGRIDRFGDHALVCSCKATGLYATMRSAISHTLRRSVPECGRSARKRACSLVDQVEASQRRPADVWLPRGQRSKGDAGEARLSPGPAISVETFGSSSCFWICAWLWQAPLQDSSDLPSAVWYGDDNYIALKAQVPATALLS